MNLAGWIPNKYDKNIETAMTKLHVNKSQFIKLAVLNLLKQTEVTCK